MTIFDPVMVQNAADEMTVFRMTAWGVPKVYIGMHEYAARSDMPRMIESKGLKVLYTEMLPDGWFDGMMVLRIVAENKNHELFDIRWSDANYGNWFVKNPAGGQSLYDQVPLENKVPKVNN
jgi:hypothetical protein